MTDPGIRYGIFFAPPGQLADLSVRGCAISREIFGFPAASAYPPHITILGTIAAEDESALQDAVNRAVAGHPALRAHNSGLSGENLAHGMGYHLDRWEDGTPNEPLLRFFEHLRDETAAARTFRSTDRGAEGRWSAQEKGEYRAHLTVLGLDARQRPEAAALAREALAASDLDGPREVALDSVILYRLTAEDWTGKYWEAMSWEAIGVWRLEGSTEE